MKTNHAFAILLAFAVLIVGCASHDGHNAQDVSFARDMIPHHGQALTMTSLVPSRSSSDEVKQLAEGIATTQQPEIATLNRFLSSWGEDTVDPLSSTDHSDHGKTMPGMMTDEQMKELENQTGTAFDRAFLRLMVLHHEGAVEMAEKEVKEGKRAEAKALAEVIIRTQQQEISKMNQIAAALPAS